MSRVPRLTAGEKLTETKLRKWSDAIDHANGLSPPGKWLDTSSELAMFELGPSWVAGEGPSATPKEPLGYMKCDGCRLVYYFPGTGEYHIKTGGLDRTEIVWSITPGKSTPASTEGDWVWCVYNVHSSRWEVLTGSGGGGSTTIRFQILSLGPFTSESSAYCLTVLAEVLDVSCNGSGVNIGDEVVIWDPDQCQFSIPAELLVGLRGSAIMMRWANADTLGTGTGTGTNIPIPGRGGGISQCVGDLGSGTGWVEGECWWMVQTLCCGEEIYY